MPSSLEPFTKYQDQLEETERDRFERLYKKISRDGFKRGPCEFRPQKKIITYNCVIVPISRTQFDICKLLAVLPDCVISREEIADFIQLGLDVNDRAIDSHIRHIRDGFKKISDSYNPIGTYYRVGYFWKTPDQQGKKYGQFHRSKRL